MHSCLIIMLHTSPGLAVQMTFPDHDYEWDPKHLLFQILYKSLTDYSASTDKTTYSFI